MEIITKALIAFGADVNIANNKGGTPLMIAAKIGNVEAAEALIKGGADVNITKQNGDTALKLAIRRGNVKIAKALIAFGADVNIANNQGGTPLMTAAKIGHMEAAEALINGGADVNIADQNGNTALKLAIRRGNVNIAKALIASGAEVNIAANEGVTPLMIAAGIGNVEAAEALIKGGADINITTKNRKTALMIAVDRGNVNIAKALIASGAEVNIADNEGVTPLMIAAGIGNIKVTEILINCGGDSNMVSTNGSTALMIAVGNGNLEIAQVLININTDVNIGNENGQTALMIAVDLGKKEIAKELIDFGANVNIIDNEGKTALMKAAHRGDLENTLALISAGADLNIADNNGETAIMNAAYSGNREVLEAIINGRPSVDTSDFGIETSSRYTERKCDVATPVQRSKAVVEMRDDRGRTALFYAILGSYDNTSILLSNFPSLHQMTDNSNVNIVSFLIHKCLSGAVLPMHAIEMLKLLNKISVFDEEAVIKEILDAVFCKLPSYKSLSNVCILILPMLEVALNLAKDERKNTIQTIISALLELNEFDLSEILDILRMMIKSGADPNTADENGNIAFHYVVLRILSERPKDSICQKIEELGMSLNRKNHNQETPLLFFLSNAIEIVKAKGRIPGIGHVVEISKFLLRDTASVNEQTQSGKSVFHLLIQLFQEGFNLKDENYQAIFLRKMLQLLENFSPPRVKTDVAVNKVDEQMNSPLHIWASLRLPLTKQYHCKNTEMNFESLLEKIFNYLLKCGAHLNPRNKNDETPLHWCQTWSSVKLLAAAKAKTHVVDVTDRSPVHFAATKNLFSNNPDYFYPDVTDDPTIFWKHLSSKGFDFLTSDKDGKSVLSCLLEKNAFKLTRGLIEAVCDKCSPLQVEDDALVNILETICKDKSLRTTLKEMLVKMILKSIEKKQKDLSNCLRFCCLNICNDISASGTCERQRITDPSQGNKDLSEVVATVSKDSVHWKIAKQLLLNGASSELCLDLAEGCRDLNDFLTMPQNIDELPMVIPWTSYSKKHKKRLAEVARNRNCKTVDGTIYWHHCEPIGSGTFGHVFAGINEKDGMEVAVKRIEKLRMVRPEVEREIRTFTALTNCKQIVRYLGFWESSDFSYVVLELMEGNLDDYFESDSYDPGKSTIISKDIAMGLEYLHNHDILHRDLKPSNILYKTHPRLCLKIADFGLSRPSNINFSESVMDKGVGTRGWIAPEVVKSPQYVHTKSSDIFSFGLVLHYLFAEQQHPFDSPVLTGESSEQILQKRESNILDYKLDGWCNLLPDEVSHLLRQILEEFEDETQRLTASELLAQPLFWSDKKKMEFLCAVGNQPDFERPRAKKPLTAIENDLEGSFSSIVKFSEWNDARYTYMPTIYADVTQRIVKTKKNGKSYTVPSRMYDTSSVVELVRFIRNAHAHVVNRKSSVKDNILSKFVFLKEFPNLLMEVYKAVFKHGWDAKKEIQYIIQN